MEQIIILKWLFLKVRLTEETANLTKGYDVVCGFANDNINKETIDIMAKNGIKLLAMRCAGFNNVSLRMLMKDLKWLGFLLIHLMQ